MTHYFLLEKLQSWDRLPRHGNTNMMSDRMIAGMWIGIGIIVVVILLRVMIYNFRKKK